MDWGGRTVSYGENWVVNDGVDGIFCGSIMIFASFLLLFFFSFFFCHR